jgi:hypothetical protein
MAMFQNGEKIGAKVEPVQTRVAGPRSSTSKSGEEALFTARGRAAFRTGAPLVLRNTCQRLFNVVATSLPRRLLALLTRCLVAHQHCLSHLVVVHSNSKHQPTV